MKLVFTLTKEYFSDSVELWQSYLAAAPHINSYRIRCPMLKYKAEISSRCHQSRFVRTLRLIFQSAIEDYIPDLLNGRKKTI